jgi:hypothetical protein
MVAVMRFQSLSRYIKKLAVFVDTNVIDIGDGCNGSIVLINLIVSGVLKQVTRLE